MAQYLLLLRGSNEGLLDRSPEALQRLFEKYDAWVAGLHQANKLRAAQKLKDNVRHLVANDDGHITDGPFSETKETIGGFFVIECEHITEAVEIARQCPVLIHGGSVELRELLTEDCRYSELVK